jgi:hypothetical protein
MNQCDAYEADAGIDYLPSDRCKSDGDYEVGTKHYCRPHALVAMAMAPRPTCQFEGEGTPLGSCKGHVYDGRDPLHARCKEHGGL